MQKHKISRFFMSVFRLRNRHQVRHSVFVSYAHEDKQAVKALVSDLKNEDIKVWYDQEGLQPGDTLTVKIKKAIKKSEFFLVVITC